MQRILIALVWLNTLVAAAHAEDFSRHQQNAFSFITFGSGARWPQAPIKWVYNPSSQPSSLTTTQVVNVLKAAASRWGNACGLQFEYGGTSTATAGNNDGVSVIAWEGPLSVNSSFGGYAQTYSKKLPLIDEADIWLNPALYSNLDNLDGLVAHELGHFIGLDHSNNPNSIMFSQPYHPSAGFNQALRGDDLTGCARLYSSAGLGSAPSAYPSGNSQLSAGQSVNLYVVPYSATLSYSPQPSSSLSSTPADGSGVKFVAYFDGMTVGDALSFDLVMPDNTLYYRYATTTAYSSAYYYTYLGTSTLGMQYFPGTWRFVFLVNGVKKGERSFSVPATAALPPVPDVAWIGSPQGNGAFAFSVRNLTPDRGILSNSWGINDGLSSGDTISTSLSAGRHTVRLFTVSSNSRSGSGGSGQGVGPDNVRTGSFTLPASLTLDSPAFSATASGIRSALSLEAQVTLPTQDSGAKNIYVAVQLGGTFYYRLPTGWSVSPGALLQVTAPAVTAFSVLDGLDVNSLPSGTTLYIGYGSSLEQLVQSGRYAAVYTF